MHWETVTSKENKLVRHISRLASDAKYRRACGEYVCEGEKLLWEATRDSVQLQAVLWEETALKKAREESPEKMEYLLSLGCRCVSVPANVFGAASFLETFSGPLFVCKIEERAMPETGHCFLALDNVQDPGNVGTVIRTADAFSIDGVWLLEGTADPYQPKAARAAMGSIFRVPVYRTTADVFFAQMRALGMDVLAAALTEEAESVCSAMLTNCAVMIGNEGRGVRPENIAQCGKSVVIPMSGGAESLNAAVAAAIMMWEMSKCR